MRGAAALPPGPARGRQRCHRAEGGAVRSDVRGARVDSVLPAEVFAPRSLTARDGAVLPAEVPSAERGQWRHCASDGSALTGEISTDADRCGARRRVYGRCSAEGALLFYLSLE